MKMKISRVAQIEEAIYNKAFGEQTDMVQIMLDKAIDACKGDFHTVNNSYGTDESKAFWNATISMVKALKPELLSPNRIPRSVRGVINEFHTSVFLTEQAHLYNMETNFGFIPYLPHGRKWLYDRDCEGLNAQAHMDKIAMTRANHTKNHLIRAYRLGAWDGRQETIAKVFSTEIIYGCYGPEDCR